MRHGFDKVELRAWLEATIDVPFAEALTLLEQDGGDRADDRCAAAAGTDPTIA